MVAYHEAGHTIAGLVLSDARVVHKVTIVPRGKAGGYAIMLPREDQNLYTTKDLREQVVGLLGGRAAEQLVFNTQTSGASNDFEQATGIVRAMITEYGMSELLGPISYEGNHSMRGAATGYAQNKSYSERTAGQIDDEVRKFMEECLKEAESILDTHRDRLDVIAEKLLELETLDERTIRALFETGEMPEPLDGEQEPKSDAKSYEEVKKELQRGAEHRQVRSGDWTEESTSEDASEEADDNNSDDDDDDQNVGQKREGRNAHIDQDLD
jgi:cell division protease FtsH